MIPLGILASSVRRASALLLAPTNLVATLVEPTPTPLPDPYWDNVVGLYRAIGGQIVDVSKFGGVFTWNTGLSIDSSEETPDGLPALKLSPNKTAVITTEELGTDDFTIEMWVKAKSRHSSWPRIWSTRDVKDNAAGLHSSLYSGDGLEIMSYAGASRAGEGPAPYGVFHHIALVRQSGVYRNYLNGIDVTGVPQASQNDTNGRFVFGQGYASQVDLWFSGVRITKGVARYTEDFTPPTEPFPNFGPEPTPTPLPTVIGEAYGGGFYAGDIQYTDGQWYKLIVADKAADITGDNSFWKTSNTNTSNTGHLTDGVANTEAMIVAGIELHPAAKHCTEWVGGGYTDWYMPAKDELDVIYRNLGYNRPNCPPDFQSSGPQAFENAYYWASTQHSTGTGWVQHFSNGSQDGYYKSFGVPRVRPIRRIAFTPD